jgi:hypothetical protein
MRLASRFSPGTLRPRGIIELHIREIPELFDAFDPCPFHQRDLRAEAEKYIVESLRELRARPTAVVFHIDAASKGADDTGMIQSAIHGHFTRKAELSDRELKSLLQRGLISLVIGLAFLFALLSVSEVSSSRVFPGPLASLLRESLVIGGWVAMWRPLQIFLYDWWPIAGERRMYAALAHIPIQIHAKASAARS